MIEVSNLTRAFGPAMAVNKVSFSVDKGDIVGFLGPNGAGKTTTLRMITGYLPPTSGDVTIGGFRSSRDGKEVRRLIGYLPESNPLYEDMRVTEYLLFRAELKGIRRSERKKVLEESLERCDIAEVRGKMIGQCSKGYRQRIGLADALLGSPPVLILDEPTVGLDPVQIVHTRNLIKELSVDHTVVLSTHILPEIEAVCSRTLIIHQGRLLFDGSVDSLESTIGSGMVVTLSLYAPSGEAEKMLTEIEGVKGVSAIGDKEGNSRFEVSASEGEDIRKAIFSACAEKNFPILEMTPRHISLEDAFISITTREESEVAQ